MGFIITQDQLRNAPPESPKNAYRRGYQQGAYAALQSVEAVLGGHQTAQIAQFGPTHSHAQFLSMFPPLQEWCIAVGDWRFSNKKGAPPLPLRARRKEAVNGQSTK